VKYLGAKHGVRLQPHTEDEGCGENFGPSLINRYVFGKGNVSFASYPMTRDFLYERQPAYQEKRSADRAA